MSRRRERGRIFIDPDHREAALRERHEDSAIAAAEIDNRPVDAALAKNRRDAVDLALADVSRKWIPVLRDRKAPSRRSPGRPLPLSKAGP
jgi:hypothetical protein